MIWWWILYVAAAEYLVILKPHSRVDVATNWIRSNFRQEPPPVKRQFTIGTISGFVADFEPRGLSILSKCPEVLMIHDDTPVKQLEVVEQAPAPRHLARISQRSSFSDEPGSAYRWDDDASGQGVTVYVLDSGVNVDFDEFEGRAEVGANFTPESTDDANGHGTHVAGIVGSATYGVAKDVQITSVKVLDQRGRGSLSTIFLGMEYAVNDMEAKGVPAVMNLSLGSVRSRAFNEVVNEVVKMGMVVVVAAGNEHINACLSSPASASGAITVGAIADSDDALAPFSNWGYCVDLFAPGVRVESLDAHDPSGSATYSGTSMAAPMVAGLAAIELSKGVPPQNVRRRLVDASTRGAISFGWIRRSPNRLAYNDT
ncbi:subtilase-type proteinase Rrt12p [Diutina rugosa]